MMYLSYHKGAITFHLHPTMSNMLAQHHFSSQSGIATRAGPNVLWMSGILASESSELSGSMIVSVVLPASVCQVNFLGKGGRLLVR